MKLERKSLLVYASNVEKQYPSKELSVLESFVVMNAVRHIGVSMIQRLNAWLITIMFASIVVSHLPAMAKGTGSIVATIVLLKKGLVK